MAGIQIEKKQDSKPAETCKKKSFSHLNPSDPKSFWKTVKLLTKEETRIPYIEDEAGVTISDAKVKASMLNDFFSKCFNTSSPPLSDEDKHT